MGGGPDAPNRGGATCWSCCVFGGVGCFESAIPPGKIGGDGEEGSCDGGALGLWRGDGEGDNRVGVGGPDGGGDCCGNVCGCANIAVAGSGEDTEGDLDGGGGLDNATGCCGCDGGCFETAPLLEIGAGDLEERLGGGGRPPELVGAAARREPEGGIKAFGGDDADLKRGLADPTDGGPRRAFDGGGDPKRGFAGGPDRGLAGEPERGLAG